MSQESITCRKCFAENPINSHECIVCGLPLNKDKGTKVLPESQSEIEADSVSRGKRSSVFSTSFFNSASRGGSTRVPRWIIILLISLVIVVLLALFVPQIINHFLFQPISQPIPTPTPNVPTGIGPDGIGVNLVDGEYIGISDGRYAFDTKRDAGPLMLQASDSLRKGNLGPALAEWNSAYEKDTKDAEPLIYTEDQRVKNSGNPYITVIIGISVNIKKR